MQDRYKRDRYCLGKRYRAAVAQVVKQARVLRELQQLADARLLISLHVSVDTADAIDSLELAADKLERLFHSWRSGCLKQRRFLRDVVEES